MSQPPLRSVTEAIRALRAFRHKGRLGVTELAEILERPKSSTHRLVATLTQAGLLEQPERGDYRLHLIAVSELVSIARAASPLLKACRPALLRLAEETAVTAYLSAPSDSVSVVVDLREGPRCRTVREVGSRSPLHATSSGQAMLSRSPSVDIDRTIARGLPAVTDETLTNPEALQRALAEARRRGFAVSMGDSIEGYCSAASPVLGRGEDVLGAISVGAFSEGPGAVEPGQVMVWGERVAEEALAASSRLTR